MTRILIEALWTIEDCNCLIWSLNLQIFPAGQNFSMDRDWIIHARLCHLCPAVWPLFQIHPERTADSKHLSLSSAPHPRTQALLLLNWHLWSGAQILLSHSWSSLNELSICQIHMSLARVSPDCPLGAMSSNTQRPAAPEPPSAAGSCALQHIHGIYLRGCFGVPSLLTVGACTAPRTWGTGTLQGQAKPEESQVSSSKMYCLNSPGTSKHILVPLI